MQTGAINDKNTGATTPPIVASSPALAGNAADNVALVLWLPAEWNEASQQDATKLADRLMESLSAIRQYSVLDSENESNSCMQLLNQAIHDFFLKSRTLTRPIPKKKNLSSGIGGWGYSRHELAQIPMPPVWERQKVDTDKVFDDEMVRLLEKIQDALSDLTDLARLLLSTWYISRQEFWQLLAPKLSLRKGLMDLSSELLKSIEDPDRRSPWNFQGIPRKI